MAMTLAKKEAIIAMSVPFGMLTAPLLDGAPVT